MRTSAANGWRELASVLAVSTVLASALTYPIAFKIGRVGRNDADGLFSIWNVAWVAHALTSDSTRVFDANIFYPHRGTLAFSENNLGGGILATPVYAATRNPYAAHNFVVLLAFVLAAGGTYYLVRYLTHDRRAAIVSGVCFAFCPYVFSHLAHIQLLMTAGLPLSMLAFHRMADRPSVYRGMVLGLVMAAQAISCGYYGVFAMLTIAYALVVTAAVRGLWLHRSYWIATAVAAIVAIGLILPAFIPYLWVQQAGLKRVLADARFYSPNLSSYLASSSYAHAWMLNFIHWRKEVLFPGFLVSALGIAGIVRGLRTPRRELVFLYGGLTLVAFWASFGPEAGLYSLLYKTVPGFTFLRAPGRLGLLVVLGLAVLGGIALSDLLPHSARGTALGCALALVAAGELATPLRVPDAPPTERVYRTLATLPPGPVIEMPFFYPAVGLYQHTKYMVASTSHWMPLVNGYSDYIPPDFYEHVMLLAAFPSRDAFKILEPGGVRYAVLHMYGYNPENRHDVVTRLKEFAQYLRPLYKDEQSELYEIVGYPP